LAIASVPEKKAPDRLSRLDLANWMVAPENPLTARVFVNRLWKIAFGQGLVRNMDDFGTQGTPPSHPELLDWLATEFIRSKWDVKAMLKLMLVSNTYRQSSIADQKTRAISGLPGKIASGLMPSLFVIKRWPLVAC
jgi:hypothetical protein